MAQDIYPSTGYDSVFPGVPDAPRVSNPGGPAGYGSVPSAPRQPIQASRPNSWPGSMPNQQANPVQAASMQTVQPQVAQPPSAVSADFAQPGAAVPQLGAGASIPFTRMQMVGWVGSDAILVSDVLDTLGELFDRNGDQIPPEQRESQRANLIQDVLAAVDEALSGTLQGTSLTPEEQSHKAMLRQLLKQQIETKLLYIEAKRKIPAEQLPNVEKQFNKQFEQNEVKKLMKQYQVETWRDLDQVLRARGSSYERERRAIFEKGLGQEWLWTQIKRDEEITYEQMIAYYREHTEEFDKPACTRWQILTIPFSKYPAKEAAYAAIARMGNQALGGADFAKVAQASDTGSDGAINDWPDKGQMVTPIIEQAILGLPAGQMSPILEDWRGYHIVKVVERQTAHRETFELAQAEIRDKIRQQRIQDQIQKYLTRLKEQIPVWTILDDKPPSARVADRSAALK
jgi:hypothetical protein